MNRKIIYAIFIGLLIVGGVVFRKQAEDIVGKIVYYSPCDYPIRYSIGTIDSRFSTTHEELLEDSKAAANVWNAAQSKQLFLYDPKATFTINLVYDQRQKLTSEISDLNSDLKQKQSEIDPKIEDFKADQADFEKRLNDLNEKIRYWNEKGGAPKEEYEKLVAEQKQLQAEASVLNRTAQELGQSTKEYNANAQKLNSTISNFKNVLEVMPEEGLYEQDGARRKISIYIDVDESEFLHTLTHEMGHALGLDHNENPKSIMYPQTTTALSPSEDDLSNLAEVCKKRTVFEVVASRVNYLIEYLNTKLQKS